MYNNKGTGFRDLTMTDFSTTYFICVLRQATNLLEYYYIMNVTPLP